MQWISRRSQSGSPIHSVIHLLPFCVMSHLAMWYCYVELLGDPQTALFHRQLDIFLQGSAHWNKR
ncbi:hypothetical protein H5410_036395 [Solanum commersonii]|uniref:Uncharacterized protein n=1 Tax=Solanum commersonii TaxID=4109 RepID=A0A9J5Y3F1_SOLCO|nr:hypothetical protein H5410_036395 [Solanum commersonii]